MKRREKGVALIWVYLIASFLAAFLVSMYGLSTWQTKQEAREASTKQAFYLAEAGIDAMYKKLSNDVTDTNPIPPTVLAGIGTYQASYNSSKRLITATGISGGVQQVTAAKLNIIQSTVPRGLIGAVNTTAHYVQVENATIATGTDYKRDDVLVAYTYADQPTNPATNYHATVCHSNGTAVPCPVTTETPVGHVRPRYAGKGYPTLTQVINPVASARTEANFNVKNVLCVNTLDDIDQMASTVKPTGAFYNQAYYYKMSSAGTAPETIQFATGDALPSNGTLIIKNMLPTAKTVEILGHFEGLVVLVGNTNLKLGQGTLIAGSVFTMENETPVITGPDEGGSEPPAPPTGCGGKFQPPCVVVAPMQPILIDGVDDPNAGKILFSHQALANLPSLPGADYTQVLIEGWSNKPATLLTSGEFPSSQTPGDTPAVGDDSPGIIGDPGDKDPLEGNGEPDNLGNPSGNDGTGTDLDNPDDSGNDNDQGEDGKPDDSGKTGDKTTDDTLTAVTK